MAEILQFDGDPALQLPPGEEVLTKERKERGDVRELIGTRGGAEFKRDVKSLARWLHEEGVINEIHLLHALRYQRWRVDVIVETSGQLLEYEPLEVTPNSSEVRDGFGSIGFRNIIKNMKNPHVMMVNRALDTRATEAWDMGLDKKNQKFAQVFVWKCRTAHRLAFEGLTQAMKYAMEAIEAERKKNGVDSKK